MSFYLPVHLSWLLLPLLRFHTSVIHSIFSSLCRRNWFWHSTPPHQQPVNTFGNVLWKIRHFTSEPSFYLSLSLPLSLSLLHTLYVCLLTSICLWFGVFIQYHSKFVVSMILQSISISSKCVFYSIKESWKKCIVVSTKKY